MWWRSKCGREDKSSFHNLCECDALAGLGIGQRILRQACPDAANIGEAELRALLSAAMCELWPVNRAQESNESRYGGIFLVASLTT